MSVQTMRVSGGVYLLPNGDHSKVMRVRRLGPTRWAVDVATSFPPEFVELNDDGLIVGIARAAGMSADELGELGYTGDVAQWREVASSFDTKNEAAEYANRYPKGGGDNKQAPRSGNDGPDSLRSLLRF